MKDGVDVTVQPDKTLTELEKELLEKFQVGCLPTFNRISPDLGLANACGAGSAL